MRCPSCGSCLVELERSEVLIARAPSAAACGLTAGELDRILDRERRAAAAVTDDDQDFFDEMEGPGRRRRPGPAMVFAERP